MSDANPLNISTYKDSFIFVFLIANRTNFFKLNLLSLFLGAEIKFDKINSNMAKNKTKTAVLIKESMVMSQPKNMGIIIFTRPANPDL